MIWVETLGCIRKKPRIIRCKIVFLDGSDIVREFKNNSKGEDVLDAAYQHLNLLETAYFGLRFVNRWGINDWLNGKSILSKQLKGIQPIFLYFGVKFYVTDPCRLQEELTRYQFYLQVKQDIQQGRLPVTFDLAAQLGAYSLQSELGDYDPTLHLPGYASQFRFVPGEGMLLWTKIEEIHKKLKGMTPAIAEKQYLDKVKWLDVYGIDLHNVLGEDHTEYYLGLTPSGIVILQGQTKIGIYFWPRITKVRYRGKQFVLKTHDKSGCEHTLNFLCSSRIASYQLWQRCIEHHTFFRLGEVPTFSFWLQGPQFSGRTEAQAQREISLRIRDPPNVTRTLSQKKDNKLVMHNFQHTRSVNELLEENISIPVNAQQITKSRCNSPLSVRSAPTPWSHEIPHKGLYSVHSPALRKHINRCSGHISDYDSDISLDSIKKRKEKRHHDQMVIHHKIINQNKQVPNVFSKTAVVRELGSSQSENGTLSHQKPYKLHTPRRIPEEVLRHLNFQPCDPTGLTAEQLQEIPYVCVETKTRLAKVRQTSNKSADQAGSNIIPQPAPRKPRHTEDQHAYVNINTFPRFHPVSNLRSRTHSDLFHQSSLELILSPLIRSAREGVIQPAIV